MTDERQTGDKERAIRLDVETELQVGELGGLMKARHVIVIGLAVSAAACSSAQPTVTPSSSAPTTVSSTSNINNCRLVFQHRQL